MVYASLTHTCGKLGGFFNQRSAASVGDNNNRRQWEGRHPGERGVVCYKRPCASSVDGWERVIRRTTIPVTCPWLRVSYPPSPIMMNHSHIRIFHLTPHGSFTVGIDTQHVHSVDLGAPGPTHLDATWWRRVAPSTTSSLRPFVTCSTRRRISRRLCSRCAVTRIVRCRVCGWLSYFLRRTRSQSLVTVRNGREKANAR